MAADPTRPNLQKGAARRHSLHRKVKPHALNLSHESLNRCQFVTVH
jgi:hypothetical protein